MSKQNSPFRSRPAPYVSGIPRSMSNRKPVKTTVRCRGCHAWARRNKAEGWMEATSGTNPDAYCPKCWEARK